jgi:hypothetical protein
METPSAQCCEDPACMNNRNDEDKLVIIFANRMLFVSAHDCLDLAAVP